MFITNFLPMRLDGSEQSLTGKQPAASETAVTRITLNSNISLDFQLALSFLLLILLAARQKVNRTNVFRHLF